MAARSDIIMSATMSVSGGSAGEQLGGRIGTRRQALFYLHRFDRLPGLQACEAVDRADVASGAREHRLHVFDFGKGQRRRRIAAVEWGGAGDAGCEVGGGGRI